ncbi:MAG: SAM-dependent chlorinase/fluorinase [Bacteroidales bacterium]|nr:SAM-dependent chlorinase/fluorinase [Bacteroidales bacterium]
MPIITLINDWKHESLYSSLIKGRLASLNANIETIDLISVFETFDYLSAAFILKNSYKNFPQGTIHLNFVTNLKQKDSDFLIAEFDNQFFISEDNGFLPIVFDNKPVKVYRLPRENTSFDELEFYPLIVKTILANMLDKLEPPTEEYVKSTLPEPAIISNRIVGHILYIDNYGNLITNFDKKFIDENCHGKKFKIVVQSERNVIETISENYSETESGDILCLFNSLGHLEIAIKDASIAELMSITRKDQVSIIFEDNSKKETGTLF